MNRWMTSASLACLTLLVGCAGTPQGPVALNHAELVKPEVRIGVAMTTVPPVDTHLPGADCLLCYAAASMANSSLTSHAKTLPSDELKQVKDQVAEILKKRGAKVRVIDEPLDLERLPKAASSGPNIAPKDFSALKSKYEVDKLLVIDVRSVGFQRAYASYIPTSDPRGWVRGSGYVVNLSNNSYEWLLPVEVLRAAEGKWDEPPKYPGLTNAYFQAIEMAKDQITAPLSQ